MSIGTQILEAKLGNSLFAESVSVRTPPSETDYTFTARVIRQSAVVDRREGKKTVLVYTYLIECLATVHATYGGLVAPQFGQEWTLPIVRGGAPLLGWKAGAPQGGDGVWRIEVKFEDIQVFGGKQMSER